MEVYTTEKAALCGVSVDPTQRHELQVILHLKQLLLLQCSYGIGGAFLARNYHSGDVKSIIFQFATQHAACLYITHGVGVRDVHEVTDYVAGTMKFPQTVK